MLPTGESLFSAYASISATFTLLQQAFYQFIPPALRAYISNFLKDWFTRKPSSTPPDLFQLIIEEGSKLHTNEVFEACQIYLCNKFSESSKVLKVSIEPHEETMSYKLADGVKFSDTFEGIHLIWSHHHVASSSEAHSAVDHHHVRSASLRHKQSNNKEKSYFSLIMDKEHKQKVCTSYLPYVLETSKDIARQEKVLKLFDCGYDFMDDLDDGYSVNMRHPFTFENLAMDPESKKVIMDDLDRFLRGKEFYKRVGKPWKRGYLLYGPPGTGKSSLIAAMANYLKFDIYDFQMGHLCSDSTLRSLLLWIPSQSIIVIEDIDCTRGLPSRDSFDLMHEDYDDSETEEEDEPEMSLAGLLNFADGLWSCCGDEKLIVFTTNHKEKLDPALLRAGRMDLHIHMSYLTMPGFNILAHNYLQISNHQLFGEIKTLLEAVNATPAEVAEELMRSEDVDIALQGVVGLLKRKKSETKDAVSFKLPAVKGRKNKENGSFEEVSKELVRINSADAAIQEVCCGRKNYS